MIIGVPLKKETYPFATLQRNFTLYILIKATARPIIKPARRGRIVKISVIGSALIISLKAVQMNRISIVKSFPPPFVIQ
jgi:hypothetical protein